VILALDNLTATQWADAMTPLLETYGQIPKMISDDMWQEWAERVIDIPGIAVQFPPVPSLYNDWKEWARYFMLTVTTEL
jgi:hypothetical protein